MLYRIDLTAPATIQCGLPFSLCAKELMSQATAGSLKSPIFLLSALLPQSLEPKVRWFGKE